MTFKLANLIIYGDRTRQKNISIVCTNLYDRNIINYSRNSKKEYSYLKVLSKFVFGLIDVCIDEDSNLSIYTFFMSIIGKFLSLGQNKAGIINFNNQACNKYIEKRLLDINYDIDHRILNGVQKYKESNQSAITAATIIAPYEVL